MEEQGPFDRVLQSEPFKRRDSAAIAVVGLAIVLGVILLILVFSPIDILDDDERAVSGQVGSTLRDELPAPPQGYEAVSGLFDLTGPGEVNRPARLTVNLSTRVLQSDVLSLYTYRGDRWQRLGGAESTANGEAASAEVPSLPDNVAIMRPLASSRVIAGILPPGAELDPAAAETLTVLHQWGLIPVSDGSIAGDRPSLSAEGVAIVPIISTLSEIDIQTVEGIITSPETRGAHVQAIRDLVREGNYAGIDIDYRGINAAVGADFTAFAEEVSTALREDGKTLTLMLPLPVRANDTWDTLGFDWQALTSAADTIEIAPVDPDAYHQRIEEALGYVTAQAGSSKVLLPLLTLSRERAPDGTRLLSLADALALAATPALGVEGSVAGGATVPLIGQNVSTGTGASGIGWEEATQAVTFRFTGLGGEHSVWLANRFSEAYRLDLARRHQLGGAVIEDVSLGAADAAIWPAVSQYASSGDVALMRPNGTLLQPRWQASGGTLSSDAGAQVDWTAPAEGGALTVTLIVSDGVLRVGQELQVQVAAQAAP
jgi:hypothetical protein